MRFWQATVLDALGNKYNVRVWTEASTLFTRSEERIKKLCEAALNLNRQGASEHLLEIAEIEEQAYRLLKAA
jgi:nicotinamidase-related amidase